MPLNKGVFWFQPVLSKQFYRKVTFFKKGKFIFFNSLKRWVIVKLRQGSCKEGMALKAKGLKPLPRAYIKIGCHHTPPPPPTISSKFNFTQLMARWGSGEVGGGKERCVRSLWVTLGSLKVTLGSLKVTLG